MNFDPIKRKILNDVKVELADEFDRNFERKAFFSNKWQRTSRKNPAANGSPMVVTGRLRRSIRARIENDSIIFSSGAPYIAIHNEGGEITVTSRMKRFFWAKYYEKAGRIKYRKDGRKSRTSQKVSAEAEFWKAMALKKTGSKIVIEQSQFIGNAPEVEQIIHSIVNENLTEFFKDFLTPIRKN